MLYKVGGPYILLYLIQIPYVGLNFAVYESLKDWLIKTRPFGLIQDSDLNVPTRLACGAAAGTVGQTVAYPLDVIRRRMQMVGWSNAASVITGDGRSKAPLEYTGMIDAFRKTVRHEGFGALYKGLVPNSVKVSLFFQLLIFLLFLFPFARVSACPCSETPYDWMCWNFSMLIFVNFGDKDIFSLGSVLIKYEGTYLCLK